MCLWNFEFNQITLLAHVDIDVDKVDNHDNKTKEQAQKGYFLCL